ncbi:MAG: DUF4922 domain-containing protein [Bdellovibrionales bacterium]|nr:DUF4922 domain-containing protein [Bdellovibrionales bacterium]
MIKPRILSPEILAKYLPLTNESSMLNALYLQQRESWGLLKRGAESLGTVRVKMLNLNSDTVTVQYNPLRSKSVMAKVDPASIQKRACFLCVENLPEHQYGVSLPYNYIALCNPMPIFPKHFTISHADHIVQDIRGQVEAFLSAGLLFENQFYVFFNGASAGASAPDHMHFQAAPQGLLPIFDNAMNLDKLPFIGRILTVDMRYLPFFGKRYVLLSSTSREDLTSLLERLIYLLDIHHSCGKDMLNLIAQVRDGKWQVLFIPRDKHRPDCYFEEEPNSLMISPGCVELGGVFVTSREQDFERIVAENVESILNEVVLNDETFETVIDALLKK